MAQLVSTLLLALANATLERLRAKSDLAEGVLDPCLVALGNATALRAGVNAITAAGGHRAVFELCAPLPDLPFSPALHLLEGASEPDVLAHIWQRLEAAWRIHNRTAIRRDGSSALLLCCQPYRGTPAPTSQNMMICGALHALMQARGYVGLCVSARSPSGQWRELVGDDAWCCSLPRLEPGVAAFRIGWLAGPASRLRHRPLARLERWSDEAPLSACLTALSEQPERNWTPRRLAGLTGRSLRTFNRRLQAQHLTAGALIRRARLGAACLRLAASSQPLTEIAHELGFSDSAHLSRAVRQAAGVTPTEYRELARMR